MAEPKQAIKSPAFAGSHGLLIVEECGCPPKPWRRRTGASAGYAIPQVAQAPAREAPLDRREEQKTGRAGIPRPFAYGS